MSDKINKKVAHLELTADIVSAYVSNNPVLVTELLTLIGSVNATLSGLGKAVDDISPVLKPAANPKKSVFPDYIVCLENGKKFKSLKRHISTHYGLTPDEYRAKWKLPADYPMVAPNYAAVRSAMAKKLGLGRKKGAQPETAPAKRDRRPNKTAVS